MTVYLCVFVIQICRGGAIFEEFVGERRKKIFKNFFACSRVRDVMKVNIIAKSALNN